MDWSFYPPTLIPFPLIPLPIKEAMTLNWFKKKLKSKGLVSINSTSDKRSDFN